MTTLKWLLLCLLLGDLRFLFFRHLEFQNIFLKGMKLRIKFFKKLIIIKYLILKYKLININIKNKFFIRI